MSSDVKKMQTMVVRLANPKTFNFTLVGIGLAEGHDDYLLVAFRKKRIVFQKVFKSLDSAKRGFKKIVPDEIKARAKWLDFAVTTRQTNSPVGIRYVKKI